MNERGVSQLTTQTFERFKGGQMEVQNQGEGYLYRGEIKTITVENNALKVTFVWLARGEGFPPIPQRWVKHDRLVIETSLESYAVSDIGSSGYDVDGDSRVCLHAPIIGEIVVLYPPNGSRLDPSRVEGL